mgnify:FL=1
MTNQIISFNTILNELKQVPLEVWGRYAIERDILYKKVKPEEYDQLIYEADQCGILYAKKIIEETKSKDPFQIADKLGINVTMGDSKPGSKRIVFATFTTPNNVILMQTPILKTVQFVTNIEDIDHSDFTNQKIKEVLLSHELFHYIENKYKKEIYTQTKKITLWKLFGYEHKSNLRVLSEIAAMAFARTLGDIKYSPYMYDVIMYYPYDKAGASRIFNHIMKIKNEYEKGDLNV